MIAKVLVLVVVVCAVEGQSMSGGMMGAMPMANFDLSSRQGIQQFLQMEGISPSQIITTNCIANGNTCTPGGTPCCISPVMSCQPKPSSGSGNACLVVPGHREHIPQIRQILQTFGYSTERPLA